MTEHRKDKNVIRVIVDGVGNRIIYEWNSIKQEEKIPGDSSEGYYICAGVKENAVIEIIDE